MREILFRGKRADGGGWAYGSLMRYNPTHKTADIFLQGFDVSFTVDINTVEQFTGLLDKNGTEIFEGDIVRHGYYDRIIRVVEYSTDGEMGSCGCCYDRFVGAGFVAYGVDLTDCYVIGNIHDNPELLEVTNER